MKAKGDSPDRPITAHRVRQAVLLWAVFITFNIILNGTVPFALGTDMSAWTFSATKWTLVGLLIYGGFFLVVPLILVKGWQTVRRPAFLLPLLLAVIAISLWAGIKGIAVVAVFVLAYLHQRFNLSDLGIRSHGWKGDALAVLLMGLLSLIPFLFRAPLSLSDPGRAVISMLDRLFANPASSVENLFYFGFLTERLSHKTGKWLTPLLIGLMYTAHEMTNPEYWYEGMKFTMVFVTATVAAYFYIWRRSVVVVWLGDGLARFARALLG